LAWVFFQLSKTELLAIGASIFVLAALFLLLEFLKKRKNQSSPPLKTLRN